MITPKNITKIILRLLAPKKPKNLYSANGNSLLQSGHIVNTASDISSKPFLFLKIGSELFLSKIWKKEDGPSILYLNFFQH